MGRGEECEATSAGPPSQWIWLRGRWGLGVVREELPDGLGSLQLTFRHPISYRISSVHVG